jgi:hypothetical protein
MAPHLIGTLFQHHVLYVVTMHVLCVVWVCNLVSHTETGNCFKSEVSGSGRGYGTVSVGRFRCGPVLVHGGILRTALSLVISKKDRRKSPAVQCNLTNPQQGGQFDTHCQE